MVWALGLGQGFEHALEAGLQETEFGQVLITSKEGRFSQYFLLRALIEAIPGVRAVSARLEFSATVTNLQGVSKTVRVRAVNFAQEQLVTNFLTRVHHGVSRVISGLVIPVSWETSSFLFPSSRSVLSAPDGSWETTVPVSGALERPSVLLGPETVILDLNTAQSVVGSTASSFAVRLDPGVDPAVWVRDHADSFEGMPVLVQDWKVAAAPLLEEVRGGVAPLTIFWAFLTAVSGFGVLALALVCRSKGLSLWPTRSLGQWAAVFAVVLLGAFGPFFLLGALYPILEPVLTSAASGLLPVTSAHYPTWEWNWVTGLVPLGTLAATAWDPFRRGKTPAMEPRSSSLRP